MLEEAKKLCDNQKDRLSPNISVQIVRGDILQMEFADETFDIVRSDITLQHVDIPKALAEIKRVLKIKALNPKALIQTGEDLAKQDKDWIKMKGMGQMLVSKGILTEEESQDFQKRYIKACESNQIVSASVRYIVEAVKCK